MGCSFYYRGCLKDHKSQEAVVDLVNQCTEGTGHIIMPDSNKTYLASIQLDTHLLEDDSYSFDSTITDPACAFDFYGIKLDGRPITDDIDDFYSVSSQFVFHRCQPSSPAYIEKREGMLVTLKLSPWQVHDLSGYDSEKVYYGQQLYVNSGGEFRCGGGSKFALLLCLIRLRWMPDLIYSDDYDNCERMDKFIAYQGLMGKFSRPSLSFEECWDIVNDT